MFEKILATVIKGVVFTLTLTAWWYVGTLVKYLEDKGVAKELRKYAKKVNKPILNLGCGRTNYGDVNADVVRHRNVRNFMKIDANSVLPFKNKQFSSVFASNIIEHLPNPDFSLKEMKRVADKVYIGHPKWWQLGTWLAPDHCWLVFRGKPKFKFIRYNPVVAYIILGIVILFL
ncbi:class I SAM-dependent methyltransferase [Candidatus Woesearchaeota archaeon]|nr:class I SAM-dependent methyltransferase [Candidatus Woesearchaeota archaeon]